MTVKKSNNTPKNLIKLSKLLSLTLRHKAIDQGFKINSEGYINLHELLSSNIYKNYKVKDIISVVENNEKKRFNLIRIPSIEAEIENVIIEEDDIKYWFIKANQGHSIPIHNLELTPIISSTDYPTIIHGTYFDKWELIKTIGLSKMQRNHIHFSIGLPGDGGVISGMRNSCQVLIYINLEKVLQDKIPFFISSNLVVLSSGKQETGILEPEYFLKVTDIKGNELSY